MKWMHKSNRIADRINTFLCGIINTSGKLPGQNMIFGTEGKSEARRIIERGLDVRNGKSKENCTTYNCREKKM